MQKQALLLTLILLAYPASALYDSYAVIDAKGAEMCFSADGFTEKTCNQTQTMRLDGTSDHIVYILPGSYASAPANESLNAGVQYYTREMLNLSVILGGTLVFVFIMVSMLWLYSQFILRGNKGGF